MKPNILVLGVLSLLWILGGTWWLSGKVCGSGVAAPTFSFTDGKVKIGATDSHTFSYNSSKLVLPKETKASFGEIAKHINDSGKQLTLAGFYEKSEKNDNKDFDNLGIARAEAVKEELVKLKANADQIITSSKEVNNGYFVNKVLFGGVDFIVSDEKTSSTDFSEVNSTPSISINEPYIFNVESDDFNIAETSELNSYMEMIQAHLVDNPKAKVFIRAFTDNKSDKKNADNWARKVRTTFQNFGISAAQIKREASKVLDTVPSDDRLLTRVEVEIR